MTMPTTVAARALVTDSSTVSHSPPARKRQFMKIGETSTSMTSPWQDRRHARPGMPPSRSLHGGDDLLLVGFELRRDRIGDGAQPFDIGGLALVDGKTHRARLL